MMMTNKQLKVDVFRAMLPFGVLLIIAIGSKLFTTAAVV
jgi:hypothetical protein